MLDRLPLDVLRLILSALADSPNSVLAVNGTCALTRRAFRTWNGAGKAVLALLRRNLCVVRRGDAEANGDGLFQTLLDRSEALVRFAQELADDGVKGASPLTTVLQTMSAAACNATEAEQLRPVLDRLVRLCRRDEQALATDVAMEKEAGELGEEDMWTPPLDAMILRGALVLDDGALLLALIRARHLEPVDEEVAWEAAWMGRGGALRDCIAARIDMDLSAFENRTLRFAAANGDEELVALLLDTMQLEGNPYGIDATEMFHECLFTAISQGHEAVVRLLLAVPGFDASHDDSFAFIECCRGGLLSLAKEMSTRPEIRVDSRDNLAICVAATLGHVDIVDWLLTLPEVDPRAQDNGALRWAAEADELEVVARLLRDDRVDPTANGNEALIGAQRRRMTDLVTMLRSDRRCARKV